MTTLLTLPIVLPLGVGGVLLLLGRWPRLQRALSVAGAAALLAVCVAILWVVSRDGIQVAQMGDWPAPFGITLVADLLAGIMLVLGAIMGVAVTVYSLASMDPRHQPFGYHPLLHILLMGVSGAFLTGDIFNLYVWYEVMLMASFVLLVLGGERPQVEGGIKYVALNLVASGLFLAAVGLTYGIAGSLNMADLAGILPQHNPEIVTAVSLLFLVAFGIKAGVFPLFFWLPASYHTPPVAVSAIFAGLLTKVGVYSLIRVFTLLFTQDVPFTHTLILVISGLTMVTGVLGAVAQNEFRRILSFHIISQIGYMTMGLGLFTAYGLAGSVLYIIHHIIVKTNLFLVSGIAHRRCGTYELKELGGLYRADPLLAGLFLIPAMSLAGMPPLSGFFAKLALVQAALEEQSYAITAVALAVGLLTLLSMMKIWTEAFWKAAPEGHTPVPLTERAWWFGPVAGLAVLTLLIGGGAEFVFQLSLRTAEQLLTPAEYVRAVLGVAP